MGETMKPCPNPWCSSHRRDAVAAEPFIFPNDHDGGPVKVSCPVCPIEGPTEGSAAEAIEAWNHRAPPPDASVGMKALAQELREAVKPLDDLPPSIQSQSNIRIINAAHKAADILGVSPDASGRAEGEKCDECGRRYRLIYRVPNDVWPQIAPRETLGAHPEHQGGGLLCPDCAFDAAARLGITLRFDAATDWPSDTSGLREALETERAVIQVLDELPLSENAVPFVPFADVANAIDEIRGIFERAALKGSS